ncbi:MAG TPA: hypothetical protein DEF45_13370, partial [Rhodopirellula sp.]|nr:hypothetical protein [Rhodopirellula sp.]
MISRSHCKNTTIGFSMYKVWCNRCSEKNAFLNSFSTDHSGKPLVSGCVRNPSLIGVCALLLMVFSSRGFVSADESDVGSTTVNAETPARVEAAESPNGKTKIDLTDLDLAELELLVGPRALSRAFRNAARKATPATVT